MCVGLPVPSPRLRDAFAAHDSDRPTDTPRKYCSASCRSRAKDRTLAPYRLELARAFHRLLADAPTVLCSDVEAIVEPPERAQADHREEARRCARRLVAFGWAAQGVEGEMRGVEAVQGGRVVETSFAKGEWGIHFR